MIQKVGEALSRIVETVGKSNDQVSQIAAAVEEQSAAAEEIAGNAAKTSGSASEVKAMADDIMSEVDELVDIAEILMDSMGIFKTTKNPDNLFIENAVQTAVQISAAMQKAVDSGQISMNDLFDDKYVSIDGTNPQQFVIRSQPFLEQILPQIQEPVLKLNERIAFCVAVDRNGFLPVHNAVYSKPQRRVATDEDLAWNTANCRNKKFFKDRVGYAAAQNQNKFLLRAYRRDMGGGEFVQMKDASAPIYVSGKHWGGLRIGYRSAG
ncbi:MAG: hypothetical protein HQL08_14480 [Nitrospirae bacterium]|nr:hypothetical protein [Nitrospirota bacterium]